MDIPIVNMRDNFIRATSDIATRLGLHPNESFSKDGGMCHILLNIFKLFKSLRNEKAKIITIYPVKFLQKFKNKFKTKMKYTTFMIYDF